MTTITKIIVTTIMAILLSSCNFDMHFNPGVNGNGNVITDERIIDQNFTAIDANAGLDVYLTQSGTNSVVVEADENLQDMIKTYVEGNVLVITVDGNISFAESKKVMVNFGDIEQIESHSGSDVYSEGLIKADNLLLSASSGSDMNVEVLVNNLELEASSGADLLVKGKTNKLRAESSSGSDIQASDLESQICEAKASSGGGISIHTKKELMASASSGGDISYSGNPEKVKTNDSPSGSIRGN